MATAVQQKANVKVKHSICSISFMRPLNIALTADPEIPVPPVLYGGIERIVDMLARELANRGHSVTVFGHADSATAGQLIPWRGRDSRSVLDTAQNMATLASAVSRHKFDIVHSFSRIAYLAPILSAPTPKLMTYQRAVTRRTAAMGVRFSRGTLAFTAISDWMIRPVSDIGRWSMIPNGVPMDSYVFVPEVPPDAPLMFLGRIEEIKGPHLAIDIARQTGKDLIIAGNIPKGKEAWVQEHVMSKVDGEQIRYVGPVDDRQKNELLGMSQALLMPILWDEPFGIVMAEAMACGTPVLGLRRGSVPEIVIDGTTGFIGDTAEDLVRAVARLDEIRRGDCRSRTEELYSDQAVVAAYEACYLDHIERMSAGSRPR